MLFVSNHQQLLLPINDTFPFLLTIFLSYSSNGKSVSWAQAEQSTSRGSHLWQRLSFHIKKKENNQTAVIKPFSKVCGECYSGGGDLPPHVTLPSVPSISSLRSHPNSVTEKTQELSEPVETYTMIYQPQVASPISTVTQRLGADFVEEPQMGGASQYTNSICSGGSSSSCGPGSSGSAVTGYESCFIAAVEQMGGPQRSIMDQISCVVNRFTANITELNSMMLLPSPTHSYPVFKNRPPSPCPAGQYLQPHDIQMPSTVTTYADIQPLPLTESSSGARGGCPIHSIPPSPYPLPPPHPHISPSLSPAHEELIPRFTNSPLRKSQLEEELIALTPPSPFRDFLGSCSSSPVSEAGFCLPPVPSHPPPSPPSLRYSQMALRNYSQSSSSL